MPSNPNLQRLHTAGVSIWLDTLSRQLLHSGEFATLVRDFSVTGATSNPTIFAKAITGSDLYDEELAGLASAGERDTQELFFSLALDDVREAARLLRPTFDDSGGRDGFISFECTPDLADDSEATIAQGTELWERLAEPNVMIKVPATEAGLRAIEELTRRGVNVNVTLLFSVQRYEQVIDAYLRGLTARAGDHQSLAQISSVASFFLSRIDSKVDAQLGDGSPLRGQVAVASARVAYQRYLAKFSGPEWQRLEALGATRQRPLWASTGTKNPDYSDVLYVADLVGPGVINTMPEHTLHAFADHGRVARTLDVDPEAPQQVLAEAAAAGIDLSGVTDELEREGVESFCDSYTSCSTAYRASWSRWTASRRRRRGRSGVAATIDTFETHKSRKSATLSRSWLETARVQTLRHCGA
jgi:transaldolase